VFFIQAYQVTWHTNYIKAYGLLHAGINHYTTLHYTTLHYGLYDY
jgi:hypothetical protein